MTTCKVLVVGAGPAGLLTAINLLRFNYDENGDEIDTPRYNVTIIDPNPDLGKVSENDLSRKFRSWMIGLSCQGLTALKNVPDLFENYVSKFGVNLDVVSVRLGTRTFSQAAENDQHEYVVDRNYVVAAMARYLNEKYGASKYFSSHYKSRALFVDTEKKQVHARNTVNGEDFNLSYDLLIGCDGVRSVVRAAFIQAHRNFEVSLSEIFNNFKSVHIQRHESIKQNEISLLPNCLSNCWGIALPETGGVLNVAIAYAPHKPCDPELFSDDPDVIAKYLQRNFKSLPLNDHQDFAKQFVEQSWSSTGQVHCNFYHSHKLNALIMGDAAHATSPAIGMGMNTALGDANTLYNLLKKYNHDHNKVLDDFSKERVKEGNALTDLSFYLNSLDMGYQVRIEVEDLIRDTLWKYLPSGWIYRSPRSMVGGGMKLSEVYDHATKMGRVKRIRKVNDNIRRDYFEEKVGMVSHSSRVYIMLRQGLAFTALVATYGAYLLRNSS